MYLQSFDLLLLVPGRILTLQPLLDQGSRDGYLQDAPGSLQDELPHLRPVSVHEPTLSILLFCSSGLILVFR